MGGAMDANAPPPLPHGSRRSAWKDPKTNLLCFTLKQFDEFSNFEEAGDPSTRNLTGSESEVLKVLVIIFLPALFEGIYSNKLACIGI